MEKLINNIKAIAASPKTQNATIFFVFVILMTAIISSQNFFFQNIVEDGISQRDVIAQKTITVIDVQRTEQVRKEVAQKVEPILIPAEDDFIKNNLRILQNSIVQIRGKKVSEKTKAEEIGILFDLSSPAQKNFVIDFLLKADEGSLQGAFDKSALTLDSVLRSGITEKDYEKDNIDKIIVANLVSDVSRRQVSIIRAMLEQVIVPNLVIDDVATEIARKSAENSVKPYEVVFKKGDKIVFEGEPVNKLKRDALRQAGYNVYELNWAGLLAIAVLVTLSTLVFLFYTKLIEKKYFESSYLLITAVLSVIMATVAVLLPTGFSPYVLPFPAYIIILSIFTSPRVALAASMLTLLILSLTFQYDTPFIVTLALLCFVCALALSKMKFSRRFDLIKTGFRIALCGFVIVISVYLLEKCLVDADSGLLLSNSIYILLNGFVSSIIALGTLPILESAFKIITPYGLAELADQNQSLLKRLQFEAPGTYHHSLMVSNLAEAAAEAIGADPILARVGSFYHDIGKLKRPLFFVENQAYFGIENPHQKLNPRLSKMVITSHPKDGAEIAKEYGLPGMVINLILQHHGDGLAKYFYNQAVEEEGEENVKEEQFRYTGPKPNSKEAAILMIADAVESAVRSMKNPTPEEIENIIDNIIVERLNDSQLIDSPLTLKDLRTIASTFSRILRGMQHNRIKYQQSIDEEINKAKISLPAKILDEDLENKIKQLEGETSE